MPLLPWYFQQAGRAPSHISKCQRHKVATKSWHSSACLSLPSVLGYHRVKKTLWQVQSTEGKQKGFISVENAPPKWLPPPSLRVHPHQKSQEFPWQCSQEISAFLPDVSTMGHRLHKKV